MMIRLLITNWSSAKKTLGPLVERNQKTTPDSERPSRETLVMKSYAAGGQRGRAADNEKESGERKEANRSDKEGRSEAAGLLKRDR